MENRAKGWIDARIPERRAIHLRDTDGWWVIARPLQIPDTGHYVACRGVGSDIYEIDDILVMNNQQLPWFTWKGKRVFRG